MAAQLIVSPLSAALLDINPWIPIMIGMALVFIGMLMSMAMPETLDLRRAVDERIDGVLHGEHGDGQNGSNGHLDDDSDGIQVNGNTTVLGNKQPIFKRMVFSAKNDMLHSWRFIASNPAILLLMISFDIGAVVKYVKLELYLQYATKRFQWTWSEVYPLQHLRCVKYRS